MPRGDGTGPMGMGPMTGRGAGFAQVLPFQVMQIQSVTDLDSNGDEALGECFMRPVCQGGHALVLKMQMGVLFIGC